MRLSLLAVIAGVPLTIGLTISPPAHADIAAPPYIEHTEWAKWGDLSSLRVYPTPSGRTATMQRISPDEAWSEVLADAPDADLPGMREQFVCHWQYAELAEPGKISWNLEPFRPLESSQEMFSSGCNPGGTLEPF